MGLGKFLYRDFPLARGRFDFFVFGFIGQAMVGFGLFFLASPGGLYYKETAFGLDRWFL